MTNSLCETRSNPVGFRAGVLTFEPVNDRVVWLGVGNKTKVHGHLVDANDAASPAELRDHAHLCAHAAHKCAWSLLTYVRMRSVK